MFLWYLKLQIFKTKLSFCISQFFLVVSVNDPTMFLLISVGNVTSYSLWQTSHGGWLSARLWYRHWKGLQLISFSKSPVPVVSRVFYYTLPSPFLLPFKGLLLSLYSCKNLLINLPLLCLQWVALLSFPEAVFCFFFWSISFFGSLTTKHSQLSIQCTS